MKKFMLLIVLVASCGLSFAQNIDDDPDVSMPLYKEQLLQYAVKQYVEKQINATSRAYVTGWAYRGAEAFYYEAEVKLTIKENGALKKAEIVNSTGRSVLDKLILRHIRDFVRKKHVTPALKNGEPVEYSFILPLVVEYYKLPDNSNQPRYYNWGNTYRGTTPANAGSRKN